MSINKTMSTRLFLPTADMPHPAFAERNTSFMVSPRTKGRTGIVITAPHAGQFFPNTDSFAARLHKPLHDLKRRGDTYTDSLIFPAAEKHSVSLLAANVAPTVINFGRAKTSIGEHDLQDIPHTLTIDRNDTFAARGQGLISTTSFVDGTPIFKDGLKRTEHEVMMLLRDLYDPYHAKMNALIEAEIDGDRPVLIFDVHSYPKYALEGEPDPTGTERPDVLFSNRDGTSCPHELLEACLSLTKEFGLKGGQNDPYKGGATTQLHSMANPDRPFKQTWSLQIEMARAAYGMDEKTLEITDPKAFANMQRFLIRVAETQKNFVQEWTP